RMRPAGARTNHSGASGRRPRRDGVSDRGASAHSLIAWAHPHALTRSQHLLRLAGPHPRSPGRRRCARAYLEQHVTEVLAYDVLALALGVCATTAVFTLLDRVVLRPLPYPDPERLLMVWETNDAKRLSHERLSPVNFMDYRGLSQVFDDAAAWWYPQLNLTETGRDPMRVASTEPSANFFAVVGAQP